MENFMKTYLRNLLRRLPGRSRARGSARPSATSRLHVESLEERAVPAVMNLTGYTFALPGGTLHVTTENVITGVFHATFDDASSGIDVCVTGKLTPVGSHWDT
jgi:hypothetical protein